jgi:hypothetical protein
VGRFFFALSALVHCVVPAKAGIHRPLAQRPTLKPEARLLSMGPGFRRGSFPAVPEMTVVCFVLHLTQTAPFFRLVRAGALFAAFKIQGLHFPRKSSFKPSC